MLEMLSSINSLNNLSNISTSDKIIISHLDNGIDKAYSSTVGEFLNNVILKKQLYTATHSSSDPKKWYWQNLPDYDNIGLDRFNEIYIVYSNGTTAGNIGYSRGIFSTSYDRLRTIVSDSVEYRMIELSSGVITINKLGDNSHKASLTFGGMYNAIAAVYGVIYKFGIGKIFNGKSGDIIS